MRKKALIVTLLCSLLATACSQASFFAVNLPTHFADMKRVNGVAYGPLAEQKLDIYLPPDARPDSALPVVVFYYGGRWETGSRADYAFVASALVKKHYIVVIPDYRKYPQVKFPVFAEDGARALAWTADHIDEYGGDAGNIQVAGHSAGAHIGALIATDPRYLAAYGKDRSIVKSFVGLAGPYDFTPDEKDLQDMFGPPANYPAMQVTTFVDGKEPPMLLLWGDADTFVGKFNMEKLAAAIRRKGGCVRTKIYPGVDHAWLAGALSWLGGAKAPVLSDMTAFFANPDCR